MSIITMTINTIHIIITHQIILILMISLFSTFHHICILINIYRPILIILTQIWLIIRHCIFIWLVLHTMNRLIYLFHILLFKILWWCYYLVAIIMENRIVLLIDIQIKIKNRLILIIVDYDLFLNRRVSG